MRVFTGGIATETNTFAPMPTGLGSFRDRGYYPAGTHPDTMSFFSGPLWAAPIACQRRSPVSSIRSGPIRQRSFSKTNAANSNEIPSCFRWFRRFFAWPHFVTHYVYTDCIPQTVLTSTVVLSNDGVAVLQLQGWASGR